MTKILSRLVRYVHIIAHKNSFVNHIFVNLKNLRDYIFG